MNSTSGTMYIVLALAIAYAFTYPMYNELFAIMDQKQVYEDALATVATIESKKSQLEQAYASIPEASKKEIETLLPKSPSSVALVSQIDTVAAKYGISIDNIISSEVSQSLPGAIADGAQPNPYQTSIIGFGFISTYENFRKFTDDLEKSLRILDVSSVRITPQTKGLYNFVIEFETYWFK